MPESICGLDTIRRGSGIDVGVFGLAKLLKRPDGVIGTGGTLEAPIPTAGTFGLDKRSMVCFEGVAGIGGAARDELIDRPVASLWGDFSGMSEVVIRLSWSPLGVWERPRPRDDVAPTRVSDDWEIVLSGDCMPRSGPVSDTLATVPEFHGGRSADETREDRSPT